MAVDRLPGRYYSIHDDTAGALGEAVRKRTGSWANLTPPQMIEKLNKPFFEAYDLDIYHRDQSDVWTRPEGWPNLDSLNLTLEGDQEIVYMTYDADAEAAAVSLKIDLKSGGSATVDIGHIENGVYVADETQAITASTTYTEWLTEYEGYVVVRITGSLTHLYMAAATGDGFTMAARQQPMLERIAYIPNLVYLSSSTTIFWAPWSLQREKIVGGASLTSLHSAWNDCQSLRSLDISGLYTPNVTAMDSCFYNCMNLPDIDPKHWDVSNVTTFASMFYGCRSLRSLDLRGWDTGKATTMVSMFYYCHCLKEVKGLADFDTHLCTTFATMFYACFCLAEAPVSSWNVGNVTTLSGMFQNCRSLESLDLSGWDVGKVTNLSSMFNGCHSLKRVKITGWVTGTLTTVASMFQDCHSLQEIDLSGIIVTSACTNIYSMFSGCWSLKELAFPAWNVTGLGNGNNTANSMFANCYSLEKITGIKNWDFRLTNSLGSMFSACRSLKELDVSGWNVSTVTSFASMFANCWSLKELDLHAWNTQNCTSFASMFQYCYSLRSVGNIGGWNTAKVTTLASMFGQCWTIREIPELSNWDVKKVTTCASMFTECIALKEITIKNWNLAVCTTVATMFRYCYMLEKAVLTGWTLNAITANPAQFLGDCYALKDVYVSAIKLNHSYASSRSLSHESLIRILDSLPSVSGKTINLTNTNVARLTAAEKAVATAKGWTVAN